MYSIACNSQWTERGKSITLYTFHSIQAFLQAYKQSHRRKRENNFPRATHQVFLFFCFFVFLFFCFFLNSCNLNLFLFQRKVLRDRVDQTSCNWRIETSSGYVLRGHQDRRLQTWVSIHLCVGDPWSPPFWRRLQQRHHTQRKSIYINSV